MEREDLGSESVVFGCHSSRLSLEELVPGDGFVVSAAKLGVGFDVLEGLELVKHLVVFPFDLRLIALELLQPLRHQRILLRRFRHIRGESLVLLKHQIVLFLDVLHL